MATVTKLANFVGRRYDGDVASRSDISLALFRCFLRLDVAGSNSDRRGDAPQIRFSHMPPIQIGVAQGSCQCPPRSTYPGASADLPDCVLGKGISPSVVVRHGMKAVLRFSCSLGLAVCISRQWTAAGIHSIALLKPQPGWRDTYGDKTAPVVVAGIYFSPSSSPSSTPEIGLPPAV